MSGIGNLTGDISPGQTILVQGNVLGRNTTITAPAGFINVGTISAPINPAVTLTDSNLILGPSGTGAASFADIA